MICNICNKPLTGSYLVDVWNNKICEAHFNKDAVHCDSCTAFTRKEHVLPDGRVLCKTCYGSVIKSGDSIENVKNFVVNALFKAGFYDLRIEDISFEIVTAQKMAEIRRTPIDLQVKGFTWSNVTTSSLYGILTTRKEFKHIIYMLTHLTNVEFAGTLAHEMLHAWLTQNGVIMSQKKVEGFCNMGSYLVYSSMQGEFAKMQLKSLHESPDLIYGDGFREMHAHYERLGWKELIEKVRNKRIVEKYIPQRNNLYSEFQKVIKFVKSTF